MVFLILMVVLGAASTTSAQSSDRTNAVELGNFSLEQLINIEITSVGKKETRLFRSPAAVAVLTQDDLRRLGATSIPEALRAVPGVQVARISGNRWAISARGLNDEFSNKLLVLVDGRSVYTPLYGGVYWNVQDVVLEDLDRIEIIRGPGATLWGANAVNGVINIITKSAKETQGTLVSTTVGTEDQPSVSVRYGGQLATNVFYRVYAKYFNREGFDDAQGHGMSDDWNMARGGARVDWEASEQNSFTLSGDYYAGSYGEQVGKVSAFPPSFHNIGVDAPTSGGNVLGRWTRKFSEQSELKLQAYYDHYDRDQPFGGGVLVADLPGEFDPSQNRVNERRDTWDVDLQHRFALGERNDVMWGLGYRRTQDRIQPRATEQLWRRESAEDDLYSGFLQDEISLMPDTLSFTLGTKLEHNHYTGFEIQPSARLLWTPNEHHSVWASVSRAVRTPTRLERDVDRINIAAAPGAPPVLISVFGNPTAQAEELIAYELGYRFEPIQRLSVDLAAYYNDYNLLANVQGSGGVEFDPPPVHWLQDYTPVNGIRGHVYGTELLAQWQATSAWRVSAAYTWLQTQFEPSLYAAKTSPEHQFHVRSSLDLGRGWEFDAVAYYVGSVKALSMGSADLKQISAYVRLDLGLTWKPSDHLEFSVWGQNLLDQSHAEFGSYKTPNIAEIPRSVFGKVTLRF